MARMKRLNFNSIGNFTGFVKLLYNDLYGNDNEESTVYYFQSGLHVVSVIRCLVKFTGTDYSD
jgi:hypothetical protein